MKKIRPELLRFQHTTEMRKRRNELRSARIQSVKDDKKAAFVRLNRAHLEQVDLRNAVKRRLYQRRVLNSGTETVVVSGNIGIEEDGGLQSFLDIAERCIESPHAELLLDFGQCTRMWPSAVTLFCSLKEWVTLARFGSKAQKVSSTLPNDSYVESYLVHCGFNEFVNVNQPIRRAPEYPDDDIVKIELETDPSCIKMREDQIMKLIRKHACWDEDRCKTFESIVLAEILTNITEHGINHTRKGWWLLAQHHSRHGIISLCFADNGIGIRNSLVTGPQRNEIQKRLTSSTKLDGEFIKLATDPNVSGALTARSEIGKKGHPGKKRGRGLKVILAACTDLGIKFKILSHYGYVVWGEDGKEVCRGARDRRIFAGTMYHLVINCHKGKEVADGTV